ncbi:30S ribosomal protein S18 [Candidatus Curtissbacteria bacterium RIFCSPHIGHO2_01_FULL_41_44]|uniref:Small ribosomal subunit protein bS18 n=1 Tax=Candidatus Curtissbacteria bacterium RIFCSPLOWO2_01_FULL_42_50 TaxID=1797730 RepID=A0A1F5H7X9_9BACT|nr:MAG: 30S ribosomal protein S18 [Candidatus Curtissbacteria bacterium RIFCSPHIGHO2_01_FULL_41_44]OGD94323.1 MAG: 30S ribosomal protein S18 [Candidatus Curtissbacteria bacterium RIFCSPHIGHO2_02_FULL_42_58]OGD97797.1 MAG: 30S ribosomal protein S18 [Candidatus Curtissbacteria bacterium RIFCSPHIGHO2_12_FULL_42_33]OGE00189.1 MAG: 30S ribosomal protein S18 [Candidatus Curtissbacteria bacterium RIFCSPLOWO2_01_FULL_42_50]OGE02116.1 MAG: 30S ribosomal protein S18 [Candidatus Curtissbacteria bacterium 
MRKFIRRLAQAKHCPLCESGTKVDWKDVVLLRRYVSERGKILGRARSGICAKHQRQITKSIKRARVLALLPFQTA